MAEPAVGDVIADITADIKTIVRGEIELAKAEVVPGVKKVGVGGGILAGAAVFVVFALNVLLICLGFLYAALFWNSMSAPLALALGFLCACVTYLVIAGILAVVGLGFIKKFRKPEAAIEQGQRSVDMVSGAVKSGLANVRMIATKGKKSITQDERGHIVTVWSGPKRLEDGRGTDGTAGVGGATASKKLD